MELTNINKCLINMVAEVRELSQNILTMPRSVAEAERDYQVAKTREVMRLKESGLPATLIAEIIRGTEAVSDLRFKRDLAVETYRASQKALSVLGDSMSAYQSVLRYQVEV